MNQVSNQDLISQFEILQAYFKKEKDKGRTIAYGRGISALRSIDRKITKISDVKGVKGIGPKIIEKIQEYLNTGKISTVEEKKVILSKKTKKEVVLEELSSVWGIGTKKAEKLYAEGVKSIKDLRKNQNLLTRAQKIGLKYHEDLQKKIPRSMITSILVIMIYFLNRKFGKGTFEILIAGSYRRGAQESGDIDCLVSTQSFSLQEMIDVLTEKNVITDTLSVRTEKFMGIAHCPNSNFHLRLDIEFVPKESWGSAKLYFTGSKTFNVAMRAEAKKQGMLLNEHGLFYSRSGKKVARSPSEEEIFELLNLSYVPPERR